MSEIVHDLQGGAVGVGTRIAYAATDGRSSGLRIGKVIEVVRGHTKIEQGWERSVPTKLRVQVDFTTGYGKIEKPVLIEARFKRFVKISG